jgi:hypothetical protein
LGWAAFSPTQGAAFAAGTGFFPVQNFRAIFMRRTKNLEKNWS